MPHLPFQKMDIWKKAMLLAKQVYASTESFPQSENFGLKSQLRRASISVPSNIAEGSQRGTSKDFCHFLSIAKGSIAEIQTQVLLAKELNYFPEETAKELLATSDEIGKMLFGFMKNLHKTN